MMATDRPVAINGQSTTATTYRTCQDDLMNDVRLIKLIFPSASPQGFSPHPLVHAIDNCHNTDDGSRQWGGKLMEADDDGY